MASSGSSRKRNHRSKAGSHQNKNNASTPQQTHNNGKGRDGASSSSSLSLHQKEQQQQATSNAKQTQGHGDKNQHVKSNNSSRPHTSTQQQQQESMHQELSGSQQNNQITPETENETSKVTNSSINNKSSTNISISLRTAAPKSSTNLNAEGESSPEISDKKSLNLKVGGNFPSDSSSNSSISIHTAVFWRRRDIVQTLLQNGAKPWDVDQQGSNAFGIACKVGDVDIMRVLWDCAERTNDTAKLELRQPNKEGDTVLHVCSLAGDEEGCQFLVSKTSEILSSKNRCGETPLHLAAKCDHINICNLLLKSMVSSATDCHQLHRFVLEENERGQTAICVSILHQHSQVTRLLLDALDTLQQATYLTNRFHKVLNESQQICYSIHSPSLQHAREVFLHGLLISVSVVLIRQSEWLRQSKNNASSLYSNNNGYPGSRLDDCLTNTDIISIIVRITCNNYINKQIIQIACFLLIYLIQEVSENNNVSEIMINPVYQPLPSQNEHLCGDKISQKIALKFLQQFVNGNGPNTLLLKVSELEVNEPSDAVSMMALALPVISLVRSKVGRSWLVSNRSHLTFLKEVILQKRSVLNLLTTTCPLLPLSQLESMCQDFVRLVEATEARDREQNLAELLREEERDWKRRERKKRKHKNQHGGLNEEENEASHNVASLLDLSSDDEEMYECFDSECAEQQHGVSKVLSTITPIMDSVKMEAMNSQITSLPNVVPREEIDIVSASANDFWSCSPRQHHQTNGENSDGGKMCIPGTTDVFSKQHSNISVASSSNAMRWADVAKIGCSNSDKDMSYSDTLIHSMAKKAPGKTSSCEWPPSTDIEKLEIIKMTKNERSAYDQRHSSTLIDECRLGHSWNNMMNPYFVNSKNSDDESSPSSSSSFDSPASLMSDSFLTSRSTALMVKTDNQDSPMSDKSFPNTPKRLRKKRRLKQSTAIGKPQVSSDHCWDTSNENLAPNPITCNNLTTGDHNIISNTEFHLPIMNDPLQRTRSDNILHLPSMPNVENNKRTMTNGHNLVVDSLSSSKHEKYKPRDGTKSKILQRPESLSTLPPLKLKEFERIPSDSLYETSSPKKLLECQPRSRLLSVFKTSGDSVFNYVNSPDQTKYVFSSAGSPAGFLQTELSKPSPQASRPLDEQLQFCSQPHYTSTPPPGFQEIVSSAPLKIPTMSSAMHSVSVRTLTPVLDDEHHFGGNGGKCEVNKPSKGGKVISTVLLDRVKNPPLSMSMQQHNKTAFLSSMAWNLGNESKLSWNKLLDTKPNSTLNVSSLISKGTIENCPMSQHSPFETKMANEQETRSTLGISLPLKSSGQYNTTNLQSHPLFSTILMNRIQQRNQHRNPGCMNSCKDTSTLNSMHSCNNGDCGATRTNVEQRTNQINLDVRNSQVNTSVSNSTEESIHQINSGANSGSQSHGKHDQKHDGMLNNMHKVKVDNHVAYDESRDKHAMLMSQSSAGGESINKPSSRTRRNSTDCRCISPPVYFPEQIRDETSSDPIMTSNFPAFHDVQTSDFLSEMFSDPLFSDNIATNQIRQKILFNPTCQTSPDGMSPNQEVSDIDLDYYASIYQMRFRDVLGGRSGQSQSQNVLNSRNVGFPNKQATTKDSREWPNSNKNVFETSSMSTQQSDIVQPKRPNSRWNRTVQKMLDLLWTTRQQYGNIVLPQSIPEFSIGMAGNALLMLGLLMDKTDVAVFVLDKSLGKFVTRMVEVMSNPDVERYFLMHCKSFNETASIQYLAVDLYEYTLCEYLQLYLPTCSHSQEAYTGLVWQLLQALTFLHHKLGVPHGYLTPSWVFINKEGNLRLASFGVNASMCGDRNKPVHVMDGHSHGHGHVGQAKMDLQGGGIFEYPQQQHSWKQNEDQNQNIIEERDYNSPTFYNDICAAGKISCFILSKGQHHFGIAPLEAELNFLRDHLSLEAFDFISPMLTSDAKSQPTVDQCLKHPIFWSADKRFRLILIVGSDVLTEMKTGVALTGTGAPTMMEILSLIDINMVSPNWIHEVDSTVLKEMRSFRVYKNNLAELTLFVYNCCLHFDKLSGLAKEVLDDPCKYFQNLFPGLFMAIFRSLKSSDRIDRTCYKPFF